MAVVSRSPLSIGFLLCSFLPTILVFGKRQGSSSFIISRSNLTDQVALLSFKSLVTNDPYHILSNWNSNISICNWNGVSCSRSVQRVIALNLTNKALEGTLSSHISNLSLLQVLDLTNNSLHGHVLTDFSGIPMLKYLSLQRNHFEGLIPQTLSHCRRLQKLSLRENSFSGSIPDFLGSLTELKILNLYTNLLTGTIPVALANLSNLEEIDIGQNHMHGNIPPELQKLSRLAIFSLDFLGNVSGTISDSLFNLSNLRVITVAGNQLTGHLPKDVGRFLPNLEMLYLGANNFNGPLPASLSNATKLQILSAEFNEFSGPIPLELGSLTELRLLYLGKNMLTNIAGSHELSILTSLTKCRMLHELSLSYNLLNGILPASIGNLSSTLWNLELASNQIEGIVPLAIANLTHLESMKLYSNRIHGPIPPNIGSMQSLQELTIDDNGLEGSIPPSIYGLVNIAALYMNNNMLTGPISNSVRNLTRLQVLRLYSNNLSSTLPPGLCELKNLVELHLLDNSFTGQLPLDLGNLVQINEIDISANKLSGELPISLSKLQMLQYLNLSKNSLEGHMPENLDGMVNIQIIDLSHNKLSGDIPRSLERLRYIQILNLSFNQLEGQIPSGGNFSNLSAESFIGNMALCGAPKFHVPACSERTKKFNKTNTTRVLIGCAIGVSALLLITFTLIVISTYAKSRGLVNSEDVERLGVKFPVISYREVLHATNNFDDANFLGSGSFGSVYKGILTDGRTVAIKVLNLLFEGASTSFDVECNVMRQIRHRNLVKVITSCSNINFKALVLQYMPLGSLEGYLHSGAHRLNIFQRLDIMIDVASALEYLHHGHLETVVHCDLKPSNVLLDENMIAHVGDFGIAKIIVGQRSSTLTATLGTTGYIAPEFGMAGKASTKADVYSYGILLLEVFTRRKPTDAMFEGDHSLRRWVAEAIPIAVSDVIDIDLLEEENNETERSAVMVELLVMILEIGLSCSMESPTERMDMKQVVAALKKIRQKA